MRVVPGRSFPRDVTKRLAPPAVHGARRCEFPVWAVVDVGRAGRGKSPLNEVSGSYGARPTNSDHRRLAWKPIDPRSVNLRLDPSAPRQSRQPPAHFEALECRSLQRCSHRYSVSARPTAVEPFSPPHRHGVGHNVDSRWTEVTIVGSLGPALQSAETLHLSSSDVGAVASFYVVGAVTGALGFGWITDRFGRRFVFYVTLIVYLAGVLLSAFAWDFWSFAVFRMITGLGIGGEYAAVNSAIDELIPAKYRGRIDLIVNGSFWLGAAGGALASPFLLDQNIFPANIGWRLGFGIGGALGLSILMLRRFVPESPRWLVTHCRSEEAEATVEQIEAHVAKSTGRDLPPVNEKIEVHPRKAFGLGLILTSMLGRYRRRSILALVLMVAQSFLYNSVFFTFGLILAHFYNVPT